MREVGGREDGKVENAFFTLLDPLDQRDGEEWLSATGSSMYCDAPRDRSW